MHDARQLLMSNKVTLQDHLKIILILTSFGVNGIVVIRLKIEDNKQNP